MSTAYLPDLAGIGWTRTRGASFKTLISEAASGLEARSALQSLPRWKWELPYSYIRTGTPYFDFEKLFGFFMQQYGSLTSFFIRDQFDNSVTGQSIATGNGVTVAFQLQRTMQGYTEPIFGVDTRGSATYGPYTRPAALTPQAYVNGLPVTATFANDTGVMTLATAAGTSGQPITADFSYPFRVRFADDHLDVKGVFSTWNTGSVKLIQSRT